MDNTGSQVVHLTIAKIITTLITLASSMMMSRYLSVKEYGTYSQLTIIITLLSSLIMLGLPNSINYFLSKMDSKEERRHFLSAYYTFSTILAFLVGIVCVLCVPLFILYFKNEMLSNYLYYLGLYPWASITIASISNVLVVYGKTKKLMLINILNATSALVAIGVTFLLTLKFNIYLIIFLLLHILISLYIYYVVNSLEPGIRPIYDAGNIKKILVYSIPIGLASLVGTITVETDKLMIGGFLDTEALAIYTNSAKELPLTMVATSLTAVLLPKMARKLTKGEYKEGVDLWKITILVSYILMCFFSVACMVFAPQIMTVLYSSKYIDGVNVFRIYSCILILRTTYFGTILSCTGNTKYILYSSFLSLSLNVILNYILYHIFGFVGPAIGSVVSILLVGLFQLLHSCRILHIKLIEIFPWMGMLKISLINALWGALAMVVIKLFNIGIEPKDIVFSIFLGGFMLIIYIAIEYKQIKSLWSKLNNG